MTFMLQSAKLLDIVIQICYLEHMSTRQQERKIMPSIEIMGISNPDESGDEFRAQWNKKVEVPEENETSDPINLEEFQRCMNLFR